MNIFMFCVAARYNYACAIAQALACGGVPPAEVAAAQKLLLGALRQVLGSQGASAEQIARDPDFGTVRGQAWFVSGLQNEIDSMET
jgi:hypothetical protein